MIRTNEHDAIWDIAARLDEGAFEIIKSSSGKWMPRVTGVFKIECNNNYKAPESVRAKSNKSVACAVTALVSKNRRIAFSVLNALKRRHNLRKRLVKNMRGVKG